jgi:GDPmannose 4,6-dehydratase
MMAVYYREAYGMFAACGVLFNHESPLRTVDFVTRKITNAVARIHRGQLDHIELGNLSAERDWGFAPEYVDGMWRMVQARDPDTFVLASGRSETVREFVTLAFRAVDRQLVWEGDGEREIGREVGSGAVRVRVNPAFFRPIDGQRIAGNADKATRVLGWKAKTTLEHLSRIMVEADLEAITRGRTGSVD